MIISRLKEFDQILQLLSEKKIFLIGCGKCAKKQHTGGEPEVLELKYKLTAAGKNITGWTVLNSACSINSWDDVLEQNPAIKMSDALLIMSCGGGVSVISRYAGINVYPALDTESLGGVCCNEIVTQLCGMCGDCTIWQYGGICPVTQCSKSLLNGPCGGAVDGKCEVDERLCGWDKIFDRLKELGKLSHLEMIHEPKDHAKKSRGKKI
ncbi:MAG: methylenetetrahydrofolate reductase C-terminal domain-containing protein [Candidatus Methanoperedens sp.]|nr:methylenetetrahydrofolate reductase C-terminal domain-containing protein [Candidatus Methanoperedens sp.]